MDEMHLGEVELEDERNSATARSAKLALGGWGTATLKQNNRADGYFELVSADDLRLDLNIDGVLAFDWHVHYVFYEKLGRLIIAGTTGPSVLRVDIPQKRVFEILHMERDELLAGWNTLFYRAGQAAVLVTELCVACFDALGDLRWTGSEGRMADTTMVAIDADRVVFERNNGESWAYSIETGGYSRLKEAVGEG